MDEGSGTEKRRGEASPTNELAEPEAFEAKVLEFRRRLQRVAYLMLGHHEDAEDATQRALMKAFQARDRFRGESGLYTWLYRILVNQCKDKYKARARAQRHFVEMPDSIEAVLPSSELGADARLAQKEQQLRVRRAIAELPERYREILVLRHFEELSYEAIAEVLRCPVGTVRSRLSKARDRLRSALAESQPHNPQGE